VISLLWFLAGKQSLSNGSIRAAMFWQIVGAIILLLLCCWTLLEKQWLGLALALGLLYLEGRSIKRLYTTMWRNPQ
jgi:hypothetical protein